MSLKRKLIIITKDWVWNNPIFALVIRYADYINISKGYEKALPEIRKKADEGFSILVFPEGTRTQYGSIKRFHKGAFYIAEKLNLKLLPVIIHGAFDCFPKNEMIFKCYTTSLHFLPSIDLTKNDFGNNYSEKGKKINQYIRDKFQEISRRRGDASYYNFHIKQSFLYKGPVLEWYIKIKLMLEKNYKAFDKIIPREAKITDLGCGYGTLDYILYLTSPKRIITGIDYDDNKIKIADNISFNNKNINFITKDITKDNIEKSDIFILYDVLHYLSNEQQNNIMDKCIKNLNPGGIILIRDSDKKRNSKHLLIHIFEIFSTTLGHNKAREKLTFFSSESIKIIAEQYGLSYETIADASRTSNTLFILKKKK